MDLFMGDNQRAGFAWWCAATIFLSAFLLFQVQPLISKVILPWFGGSPAVWTTCMLFFQVLLLGGYAYAHWLNGLSRPAWQAAVHLVLLAGAAATLPITPGAAWQPADGSFPTGRILLLLLVNVGLPYFVLSSTGPLIQAWYSRAYAGRSPYRLYALSNVGSLGALLSYPFLFEPALTTGRQGALWSLAFAVFAALCACLAILTWRLPPEAAAPAVDRAVASGGKKKSRDVKKRGEQAKAAETAKPTSREFVSWLLLPALASVMFLAVTNHVCQDVAVVPLLWIAPLSLYLLSFIICFDREAWYRRRWFALAVVVSIIAICINIVHQGFDELLSRMQIPFQLAGIAGNLAVQVTLYLTAMFLVCMLCHGELVRRKPPARHLTSFYLAVAAGGALGGVFVAVICPLVFSEYYEFNLGLAAAFVLAVAVLAERTGHRKESHDEKLRQWVLGATALAATLVIVQFLTDVTDRTSLVVTRNFYGVLRVAEYKEKDRPRARALYHGRILHGFQHLDAERGSVPTEYYDEHSGVGITLRHFQQSPPLRVGVVGLGTGTLAAYGRPGDFYRFYEINPKVETLARRYFTYLKESPAEIDIVLGDARLSMERESPPRGYDVLVLDAFSGDAVPVHLLNKEAFDLYQRHLNPQGVIAVHITNRYLDLTPVVVGLAKHLGMHAVMVQRAVARQAGFADSQWMIVTNNRQLLNDATLRDAVTPMEDTAQALPLWTDQYSNLFQILK
jgi:spermidine synthase